MFLLEEASLVVDSRTPVRPAARCLASLASILLLVLTLASHVTWVSLAAGAQVTSIPEVKISGGGLGAPVSLAPTDADAFRRRINLPPRLDFEPKPEGASYTVTTPYWNEAVDREDGEERLSVDASATYWPEGGYVLTRLDSKEVWLVLDLRQRSLLDRYIRLAAISAIGSREGNLGVLATANATEYVGVDAGVTPLTAAERTAFWTAFGETPVTFLDPFEPPQPGDGGFWLLLTIADGPGYAYYYDGSTLTDSFGAERYPVNSALRSVLNGLTPAMPTIEHQDPPGSLLWWPVMVGGGLLAIGAAWWLTRRNQLRPRI